MAVFLRVANLQFGVEKGPAWSPAVHCISVTQQFYGHGEVGQGGYVLADLHNVGFPR